MYIEFDLPQGAGGMAAQYANNILNRELHTWSDLHNIPYNKKIHKYTVRVTFDQDKYYSFFAMTWAPKSKKFSSYVQNYRFVEPMKRS